MPKCVCIYNGSVKKDDRTILRLSNAVGSETDIELTNKAEAKLMCLTEYDEARTYAELREEALEEGKEEGKEEGTIRTLNQLVSNGLLTSDQAAEATGVTVSEYLEKVAKFQHS